MASRDDVLRDHEARIKALEDRLNEGDWSGELDLHLGRNHTDKMHEPLPHVGQPDPDVTEDNDNVQMAKQRLEDGGFTDTPPPERKYQEFDVDGEHTVVIPLPTEAQVEARKNFITAGGLANIRGLSADDAARAYLRGGPIWLHAFDRDYVISLPPEARGAMCVDVHMDDPVAAGELARDILKFDDAGGQSEWAMTKAEQTYDAS